MSSIDSLMDRIRSGRFALVAASLFLGSAVLAPGANAEEAAAEHEAQSVDWQEWKAGNQINDTASLQRGATNFVNYCFGCHSLKYLRFERMGKDLGIPDEQLRSNLIPTGAKPTDYMLSTFPKADAEAWFGRHHPFAPKPPANDAGPADEISRARQELALEYGAPTS